MLNARNLLGLFVLVANPVLAQQAGSAAPVISSDASVCELHVFPTENVRGAGGTGLGPGLIDTIVYGGKVASAKNQLGIFLKPSDQVSILKGDDLLTALALPAGTKIIEEAPLLSADAVQQDSALAALRTSRIEADKGHFRKTASKASCYNELTVLVLLYNATPIGNRLFATFSFRKFSEKPKADLVTEGMMVGTPTKVFPAKQEDQAEAARTEARAAFAQDFTRWAARKVKP
jgi:hypothetical protein